MFKVLENFHHTSNHSCPARPLIAPWQALCFAVLVFGVSNRVLYRMALVPMQDYVFFLAQFQNVRAMKKGEWGKGC